MDDFSAIIKYVSRYIELTPVETARYIALLTLKKVNKKQFIVQPDFICNHRTFIVKGALRAYLIDDAGQDHTVAFGIEDWFIADFNSFFFRQPATLFIEALEDSVIIQMSHENEQTLFNEVPKFERFYRILAQSGYAFLQKRIIADISLNASERYEEYIKRYPLVAARVPQYTLASYLGISHELLSKIRNKRVKRS